MKINNEIGTKIAHGFPLKDWTMCRRAKLHMQYTIWTKLWSLFFVSLPLHHQMMRMLHSQTHEIGQKNAPMDLNMQQTWRWINMEAKYKWSELRNTGDQNNLLSFKSNDKKYGWSERRKINRHESLAIRDRNNIKTKHFQNCDAA
jgi:hypothetical protein